MGANPMPLSLIISSELISGKMAHWYDQAPYILCQQTFQCRELKGILTREISFKKVLYFREADSPRLRIFRYQNIIFMFKGYCYQFQMP
jgi:hypothetical protein